MKTEGSAAMAMKVVVSLLLLCNAPASAMVLRGATTSARTTQCGEPNPLHLTSAAALLQKQNPNAGLAPFKPFAVVLKSGFAEATCVKDNMYWHGDKFGQGRHAYGLSTPVSIVRYEEWVAKEDRSEMTPQVCFDFCRSVPDMSFFGIANGRNCYCEPYYQQIASDSTDCDAPCDGDPTQMCGGNSKSTVYSMHGCGVGAGATAKAADIEADLLKTIAVKESKQSADAKDAAATAAAKAEALAKAAAEAKKTANQQAAAKEAAAKAAAQAAALAAAAAKKEAEEAKAAKEAAQKAKEEAEAAKKAAAHKEGIFVDATIYNAEYKAININGEAAAQTQCLADPSCVGYWQNTNGKFSLLFSGGRTWKAGKLPNGTVKAVKKWVKAPEKAAAKKAKEECSEDVDWNFFNSRVTQNNLGGVGPNKNDKKEVRYADVADGMDLVLTTSAPYATNPKVKVVDGKKVSGCDNNGMSGKFGQINVKGNTAVELTFTLVKSGTDTPISVTKDQSVFFSVYDLDSNKFFKGSAEYVAFKTPVDSYSVTAKSTVKITGDKSHLSATSGRTGGADDNPTDPLSMTQLQKDSAVWITYKGRNTWTMAFGEKGNKKGKGGRNLMFAGRAGKQCK